MDGHLLHTRGDWSPIPVNAESPAMCVRHAIAIGTTSGPPGTTSAVVDRLGDHAVSESARFGTPPPRSAAAKRNACAGATAASVTSFRTATRQWRYGPGSARCTHAPELTGIELVEQAGCAGRQVADRGDVEVADGDHTELVIRRDPPRRAAGGRSGVQFFFERGFSRLRSRTWLLGSGAIP